MKRFKPKSLFGQAMALIVFAVVFAAVFNRLELLWQLVLWILDLLKPLLVGAVIAFFMNVPMRGLEKLFAKWQKKRGRPVKERRNSIISLLLTYLMLPLVLFLVCYILIPQVVQAIPGVIASVEAAWPKFLAFLERHHVDTGNIISMIESIDLNKIVTTITENLETVVQTSVSAVSSVVSVLTVALTGFVISIYILANKKKLLGQARKLLYAYTSPQFAGKVTEVAALTNRTFTDFLTGQCIESLILGVMFFLTMTILRLPFALIISVFVALTALIPYVGAITGFGLGTLLILTVSPGKAFIFMIACFVIQQLENQFIYPKVVGTSVGLPPLWILVSVFVGGKISGVAGMIFFIPVVSVAYSLLRINVNNRLGKKKLSVDEDGKVSADADASGDAPPEQPEEDNME